MLSSHSTEPLPIAQSAPCCLPKRFERRFSAAGCGSQAATLKWTLRCRVFVVFSEISRVGPNNSKVPRIIDHVATSMMAMLTFRRCFSSPLHSRIYSCRDWSTRTSYRSNISGLDHRICNRSDHLKIRPAFDLLLATCLVQIHAHMDD